MDTQTSYDNEIFAFSLAEQALNKIKSISRIYSKKQTEDIFRYYLYRSASYAKPFLKQHTNEDESHGKRCNQHISFASARELYKEAMLLVTSLTNKEVCIIYV